MISGVRALPFGNPTEFNAYNPLPEGFRAEDGFLFHGTSEDCATSIVGQGFAPTGELRSSSFTRQAGLALGYACNKRKCGLRGAILVISFPSIDVRGVRNEGDVVYLDDHTIQPRVVAICLVPGSYLHT